MRRASSNLIWTPRSIFVITFLGCIALANAAYEVDARFGSGSANLAKDFHRIKGQLPHDPLPIKSFNTGNNSDSGDMMGDFQTYGIGIGKIVGPGLAIAILTILAGVIYGIIKIIRLCCCRRKRDPEDETSEEKEENSFFTLHKLIPTGIYAFCWVWLLAGMIIGIMNNPVFSDGVKDMSDYVVNVGVDAVQLGRGLNSSLFQLVGQIPVSIELIKDQVDGVPALADNVDILGVDVNSTAVQVHNITAQIAAIDAGNTSAVDSLYTQLVSIDNSSSRTIGQVADLTTEISGNLRTSLNNTLTGLDDNLRSIDSTMGQITNTAGQVIKQADDLVKTVTEYTDMTKDYDQSRQKAVTALFALIIVVTVAVAAGFLFKIPIIFNVVAGFGFVFLFFLWFSGSIHFLLGMVLNDACPVVNTIVKGMLPTDDDAGKVLNGCMYEDRSVLQSMDLESQYDFDKVFNQTASFDSFKNFATSFNFTSIDEYFESIRVLYDYNLTAVADNMTAANYGWNQSIIYDLFADLNEQTDPLYYDQSNYTTADPSIYSPPKNQTVYSLQQAINASIIANQTVNTKLAAAKLQLYAAQNDINVLLANYTEFQARYDGIKRDVNVTATTNITNCGLILDTLHNNVTDFFQQGNCSFLGNTFEGIVDSLCATMQPAIDLLTVAQFLAGLALIPMVVVAEILSFRINKNTRILPCGDNGDVYDDNGESGRGVKCDYAVALTETKGSPTPPPVRHSITATIASSPNTPEILRNDYRKSNSVSPDYVPMQQQQNYILPPLRQGAPPSRYSNVPTTQDE
jgi:Na+-transporting methylmalonyl-CoA/oxaloacetate decarboxylase gamma subunit